MTPLERLRGEVEEVLARHSYLCSFFHPTSDSITIGSCAFCNTAWPCDAHLLAVRLLKAAEWIERVKPTLSKEVEELRRCANETANAGEGDLGSIEAATCLDAEAAGVKRALLRINADRILSELAGDE